MEKTLSEDIDDSFEIYDPVVNSISDSMSIVPIPDPMASVGNTLANRLNSESSFHEIGDTLVTKRIDSADGLPTYDQIEKQDNIQRNSLTDERQQSLQKLSDNLIRIEDNMRNCSTHTIQTEELLTSNLETYLKELRDENEKMKAELEKNNRFMKQQLNVYHEWQTKNNKDIEEHQRVLQNSQLLAQENQRLKGENDSLKDKVNELEAMTRLVEQLTAEVNTLRSRCQSMANYEKFDIPSELQNQELNSRLVESQIKMDAMTAEINSLKNQLSAANSRLETLPAMESQLYIFERDFKLEEMSKLAALKELSELEVEIERLKLRNNELEERLERGAPNLDLKDDSDSVKTHSSRRSRRSGRL